MSVDPYLTFKWVHELAAGIVLGLLVVLPLLPMRPPADEADRTTVQHALGFLDQVTNWLLIPSIVVLLVTGLLMSVGPWSVWDMLTADGRWIILGMGLWMVLAGVIAGFMGGLVKEMRSLVPRGADAADRLENVWRQYRWGVFASLVIAVVTYWVMVFSPAF